MVIFHPEYSALSLWVLRPYPVFEKVVGGEMVHGERMGCHCRDARITFLKAAFLSFFLSGAVFIFGLRGNTYVKEGKVEKEREELSLVLRNAGTPRQNRMGCLESFLIS